MAVSPIQQALRSAIVTILALTAAIAILSTPATAAPSCQGKRATISSNARTIVGTKAPDVIVAGPGDNKIYGEGGNDVICAGGGDDTIHGARGNDTIHGGAGDDTAYGERGSDRLHGDGGSDVLFGETGNDRLHGDRGDGDRLFAGPGDDQLDGGAGNLDLLAGGPGRDAVAGGPGAHDIASYAGTGGAVKVDLQSQVVSGADAEGLRGIEDAVGGSDDDTLIGHRSTANRLDGGAGDDRLVAAGEGDAAFGGPGSDRCEGAHATEVSCGTAAAIDGTAVELYESIDGATSLIVTGDSDSDSVTIGAAAGVIVVTGGPGTAVAAGDPGSTVCGEAALGATVSCRGHVDTILASLGPGADRLMVDGSVPASIAAIVDAGAGSDRIRGGDGDDILYSGDDRDADTLEGGGGHDVLYGVNILHPRKDSGSARLVGGPGNDLLIGGQPCDGDLFDGGPGANDSASFARVRNSGIVVSATIGGAVLDPDTPACERGRIEHSVEKIEGSPGPDILVGDAGPNVLLGRGGGDLLRGRGGNDTCVGGGGRDRARSCETRFAVP